ncbi:MAG: hypothetical protein JWQ45_853 [Blastococcus sp.]|nr:hypothetical protein [Blastococcus sp.]
MIERSELRVSDGERQAAVDRLRVAHDEGRLDLDEYDRRLAAAYSSVTYGDLDLLFTDLPPAGAPLHVPPGRPASRVDRPRVLDAGTIGDMHLALKVLWIIWTSIVGINLTVWVLVGLGSDDAPYFWPMWLAVPGVALFVATAVTLAAQRGRPPSEGPPSRGIEK